MYAHAMTFVFLALLLLFPYLAASLDDLPVRVLPSW
jgi:hypothetical protein